MHEHDHDLAGPVPVRPRASRVEEPGSERLRAALSGRLDASGAAGVLGVQRAVGNAGAAALVARQEEDAPSPVHDVVRSPGEPLPADVRADMESRLGHDFGDVRVHDDGAAESSARAVGAHAYTVGPHIAFQRSAYDPGSDAGRRTLAHELTHVVQQRSGPVDGAEAPGGIRVSDPSDRFEREAVMAADRVVSSAAPAPAAPVQGASVQQDAEELPEEETPVQGAFLQREGEEAEEESGG